MRPGSAELAAALQGPVVKWEARVESWYGGERLSRALPLVGGSITWNDGTVETAEGTLTVAIGRDDVRDFRHPVAAYGQRLRPIIDVTTVTGRVESCPLGWFPIDRTVPESGLAEVSIRDVGVLIERAKAVTPGVVLYAGPSFSTDLPLHYLIGFGIGGIVSFKLLDEFDPVAATSWLIRDRMDWLRETLVAYAGYARPDISGALLLMSTDRYDTRVPVMTLTDGANGTLVDLDTLPDASAGHNAWIAEGTSDQGEPLYGGAFITDGPMAWPVQSDRAVDSPYGARPAFLTSPQLTTHERCIRAARSQMRVEVEGRAGAFTATAAPDPRLETNDVVNLVKDGQRRLGRVKSLTLPLVVGDGPMTLEGVLL